MIMKLRSIKVHSECSLRLLLLLSGLLQVSGGLQLTHKPLSCCSWRAIQLWWTSSVMKVKLLWHLFKKDTSIMITFTFKGSVLPDHTTSTLPLSHGAAVSVHADSSSFMCLGFQKSAYPLYKRWMNGLVFTKTMFLLCMFNCWFVNLLVQAFFAVKVKAPATRRHLFHIMTVVYLIYFCT